MIKGGAAPPKYWFHVATLIERSIYSNRTISTFDLDKSWHLPIPYTYIANYYSLAIKS